MKKIGTYLLATVLLLSLASCAPKRYERKHGPVDSSSSRQSSGKADEKTEESKSNEEDEEAIGTLSKADEADICLLYTS